MRFKNYHLIVLLFFIGFQAVISQTMVPFSGTLPGGSLQLKGDVVFVGNSILGRTTTNPTFNSSGVVTNLATLTSEANQSYTGTGNNNGQNFEYIDIDGDASTFSSSSANLAINTGAVNCKRIVYAGLYWTATYPYDRTRTSENYQEGNSNFTARNNDWNKILFKVPGGSYIPIEADNAADPVGDEDKIIFNGYNYYPSGNPDIAGTKSFKDSPYVCFKNVTNLLQSLAEPNGTYTVANMRASRGARSNGSCGGWTIVIVYESPNLPSKYLSVFDGFSGIDARFAPVDFNVNGFKTVPSPLPVRANIGAVTLEGDLGLVGDSFRYKSNSRSIFSEVSNTLNPGDNPLTTTTNESNFFNSSITNNNVSIVNRNPASTNTFGFDMDIVAINNPSNNVIPNGETGATLRVSTSGDAYSTHLVTFAVEIIEPKIVLTKTIQTPGGAPIADGSSLNLGQTVDYLIGFQNIGNDDATNVTIRDVLPVNTVFSYPSGLILPAGVTPVSYNNTTRELVLSVNPSLVKAGGARYEFRIRVRVVENCYELVDACENRIKNEAYTSYNGVINPTLITDDPSLSSFSACLLGTPSPTNFIGNIDDCKFSQDVYLCGSTVRLDAPGGYTTYTWTGPSGATITAVSGTNNQSVIVNQPGTYNVFCNAPDPCVDVPVTFNVITFGPGLVNPVITYLQDPANQPINFDIKTCPDNDLKLPYIYLCGSDDTQEIRTNISGATSIFWEKLDEGSCTAVTNFNCPNESTACSWIDRVTSPNFTVVNAGQYRLTVNFPGGCSRVFYFNVTKELLPFTVESTDIICLTPGSITVKDVPATGYEFQLLNGASVAFPWQPSNIFNNITVPGNYTVQVRKFNFPGGCVFDKLDVVVRQRNFSVTPTYTEPLCFGDRGSIRLQVNDVEPNYFFSLYLGATATGTPIDSSGPISATNDFTFANLTPGQTYTWLVTTDDGCTTRGTHTVANPSQLIANASITRVLTNCSSGEITITASGGTAPYNYFINNYPAGPAQASNIITVDDPGGTYNITVVDANNCRATTSITLTKTPVPSNIVVKPENIRCNPGPNNGTITVTANANGNNLQYSLNGGAPQSSNIFTGLAAGTYTVTVHYTAGTGTNAVTCTAVQAPVTITIPTQILVDAQITDELGCSPDTGQITVTASGGTAPLQYSINGTTFQLSNIFTVTATGNYTITVKDANGCTNTDTILVPAVQGPSDMYLKDQVKPSSCNTSGALNVDVVPGFGGQAPRRFRIVSPFVSAYQADGNFLNLAAGVYTFEVIDKNGCIYTETFRLDALAPPVITPQVLNGVRCFGQSNGNALFTVTGLPNRAKYTYSVLNTTTGATVIGTVNGTTPNSGSTTITIPLSNYPSGTYQLTFISSDYDNCTYTQSLTIGGPTAPLAATYTPVNPTCTTNGTITVTPTAGSGTPGYTYSIAPSTGVVQSNNVFSNLLAGTAYVITVTDANGCTFPINHTFTAPPAVNGTITGDFCYDTNGASLTVNITSGTAPFEYSINGGTSYQTSNTFANLTPGTYSIIVRDANGCTRTFANNTIAPQLTIAVSLQKDITCDPPPTNAVITATIAGGTSIANITVSHNGGTPVVIAGFPYSTSIPGTYQFTITDSVGCTATSNIIPVSTPVNPTASTTQTNVLCNGGNNGSITIIPSSGTAPYTISFNSSPTFTTTTTYNNLPAGNYPFIVKDNKGCIFNGSVLITEPSIALSETHNTPSFSCDPVTNASQSATLTVNGQNGTAPYQYSFNGGVSFSSTNTYTITNNGSVQTINFVVKDANGCIVSNSVTLQPLNNPVIVSVTKSTITCLATTSNVQVNVTGGVGTLTYVLTGAASATNTTGTFNNLPAGSYSVTVTDANGCFATQAFNIAPVTPIVVAGTKLSDVLCNAGNTGALQFTVTGFSGTYSYSINGGTLFTGQTANTITLNNQLANTYTIIVTDQVTGCTATASITIDQPTQALDISATGTNVNCNRDVSTITAIASGGTPNYKYAAVISGSPAPAAVAYGNSNVFTVDTNSAANLVWDVYVKDANGCIDFTTITIISDPVPVVTAVVDNQCTVATGFTITASVTGGVAPYTYNINTGAYQTSPTFTVAPGSYTVHVKDANGCIDAAPVVTVSRPLAASLRLIKDITCSAPTDATIRLTVSGGLSTYTYQILDNGVPVGGPVTMTTNPQDISINFVSSNITIEVTDSNGCKATTGAVRTTAAVPPTVNPILKNPTCNGGSNGTITLKVTLGGTSPYQYSLDGGTTFQSTNIFGGLSANIDYNYVVRDARGCTTIGTIRLTDPAPLNVTIVKTGIVCNVNTLGSFDVTVVSGGSPNYTYTLYDASFNVLATSGPIAATNYNFPGLNFGDYYIKVVDGKGCEYLSVKQRIDTQPFLTFTGQVDSNNCATGVNVTVTTSGGTAPYDYSYFGQGDLLTDTMSTTFTYPNLSHNTTYFFQVRDANGCVSILEFTTPAAPSTINITGVTTTNVTCNGSGNGTINFTVQGYDPTVTDINYVLLDALSNLPILPAVNGTLTGPAGGPVSGTISSLPPGNYNLQVREVGGTSCPANYNFIISQPPTPLTAVVSSEINANCNNGAQVEVTATGGTEPYLYAFVPDGSSPVGLYTSNNVGVLAPPTLDWDIWVQDANGCTFKIDKTITVDPIPTIDPIAQQCFVGSSLTFTVTGTSFNGNLVYGINTTNTPPAVYQALNTFAVTTPGTYYFFVKDDNDCVASTSVVVAPQLFLQADLTQDLTCLVNATIDLTASGGTSPYVTYAVSTTGSAGPFSPIAGTTYTTNTAGSYHFQVTDTQGCTAVSNEVIVTPRTNPTLTFTQVNVSCNGGNDGSIFVTAANGIAPYQYSIDNGVTFQTSPLFTGLIAGSYNVVVKDAKDCVSPATVVTITEPALLTASLTLTKGLTCGVGNAPDAAIVTASGLGGTTPYTYSFDGGVNYSPSNTYTTTLSGTVNVLVKDANGCISAAASRNIPALTPPTDLDFAATAVTCLATTSTVTLTVTSGVAPYSYEILSPIVVAPKLSNVFANLAPNNYLFQVTDANGCKYSEYFEVLPVTNIAVQGQLLTNVSCNGGNNGSVQFNVSGFAGTYSYTINGGTATTGQNSPTITSSGLLANSYQIVVTDEVTGCTATATVVVTEPTLLTISSAVATNVNCNNDISQITVTASGGTVNYTYAAVVAGSPAPVTYSSTNPIVVDTNNAANLAWDVYVRDANGCVAQTTVTIVNDPLPVVTLPGVAVDQCTSNGTTYTFTATGSSGVAPYMYSIDGVSYQASPTFTVSSTGVFTVTIKDANGCTATASITVYPPMIFSLDITADADCTPVNSAEITVTAVGGSGNYTYETIAPSVVIIPSQPSNVFSNLAPGTYTVQVTDTFLNPVTGLNETCVKTLSIDIPVPTNVNFSLTKEDVKCNGGNDGSITVTPISGDLPVTYTIVSGPATLTYPIASTGNTFGNLPAGDYEVLGINLKNCEATVSISVIEPSLVVASASATNFGCATDNSVNPAVVTVSGLGGTPGYTYSIDGINYFTSATFNIIDNGANQTITAYVKDANGCVDAIDTPLTIPTLVPLTAVVDAATRVPLTCRDSEEITILASGGSGSYTYAYEAPVGAPVGVVTQGVAPNDNQFTITQPGTYSFLVTDTNTGCYTRVTHEILPYNTILVTTALVNDVRCFGGSDGAMSINVQNYSGAYTYTVYNADTNAQIVGYVNIAANTNSANPQNITGLPLGNYYVIVTETASPFCPFQTGVQSIGTASELILTLAEGANVTCSNDQGSIAVTISGGTGATTIQVVNTTTGMNYGSTTTGLSAGDYQVTVTDANGCTDMATITLIRPIQIAGTVNIDTPLLCFGDTNGQVSVINVTGGQNIPANYTYTLNYVSNPSIPSSGPQGSATFSGLGAGDYSITINDGYTNCGVTLPFSLSQNTQVVATLREIPDTQDCQTSTQSLELTATGGSGAPYTYDVSPTGAFATSFAGTVVIPNVAPGPHTYYVKDSNGCISVASNEIKINTLEPLTITILPETRTIVNCFGDVTGAIYVDAKGGLGNYLYSINSTATGTITNITGQFPNLPQGNYTVSVASSGPNAALACNPVSTTVNITGPTVPFTTTFVPIPVQCFNGNDGAIDIVITGGTGTYQYILTPSTDGEQAIDIKNYIAGTTYTIKNLTAGTYSLTVKDSNGCITLNQQSITIGSPLSGVSFAITNYDDETCFGYNNGMIEIGNIQGGTTTATTGYSAAIYLAGTTPTFVPIPLGQTTYQATALAPGVYTIAVKDANGCTRTDVWEIKAGDNIIPRLEPFIDCENNVSIGKIRVVNDAVTSGKFPTGTTFQLVGGGQPAQTSPIFSSVNYPILLAGGNFTVDVVSPTACPKSATTTTPLPVVQVLDVKLTKSTTLNTVVATVVGGSGNYDFTFYGDNYIVQTGSSNTFTYYQQYNQIKVVVTDSSGCTDSDFGNFEYIPICTPDVMTPDGNGQNDEWGPGCIDPVVYPKLETRIYDRYGRLIATLPVGKTWNGTYEGKPLPSGDYWYVIKVDKNDGQEIVGHFTLYR